MRSLGMAIGTHHLALCGLLKHTYAGGAYATPDLEQFDAADVVELHHPRWIAHATIRAWDVLQLVEELPQLRTLRLVSGVSLGDVSLPISPVVVLQICPLTCLAQSSNSAGLARVSGEFGGVFDFSTRVALPVHNY
jgi:hypothetical protein